MSWLKETMNRAIDHDRVADLYDLYVRWTEDIPFFLDRVGGYTEPVLELTCGTGRVSIPLAAAGCKLVCVDYAPAMLRVLKAKLQRAGLTAGVVCQDIRQLGLRSGFGVVLLPFHALAELMRPEDRRQALASIAGVMRPGGRFICTLHNPFVRRRSLTARETELGRFAGPRPGTELRLFSSTDWDARQQLVTGVQRIEIVDVRGRVIETRTLPVRFALPEREEIEAAAASVGLEVVRLEGDYAAAGYEPERSPFMIWTFTRRRT